MNFENFKAVEDVKSCKRCGKIKPLSQFYNSPTNAGGKSPWCIDCRKLYMKSRKDKENRLRNSRMLDSDYREYLNARNREWRQKNREKSLLREVKARAKRRKIIFNLTEEDIVIPDICPLLELPLKNDNTTDDYISSPSLDRLDARKGYVKGNVKVISMLANTMKNSATREQLLKFSKNIIKYLNEDIVQTTAINKTVETKDKEP